MAFWSIFNQGSDRYDEENLVMYAFNLYFIVSFNNNWSFSRRKIKNPDMTVIDLTSTDEEGWLFTYHNFNNYLSYVYLVIGTKENVDKSPIEKKSLYRATSTLDESQSDFHAIFLFVILFFDFITFLFSFIKFRSFVT